MIYTSRGYIYRKKKKFWVGHKLCKSGFRKCNREELEICIQIQHVARNHVRLDLIKFIS